jgi:hypothetical protein
MAIPKSPLTESRHDALIARLYPGEHDRDSPVLIHEVIEDCKNRIARVTGTPSDSVTITIRF